jgi:hypothetical protein
MYTPARHQHSHDGRAYNRYRGRRTSGSLEAEIVSARRVETVEDLRRRSLSPFHEAAGRLSARFDHRAHANRVVTREELKQLPVGVEERMRPMIVTDGHAVTDELASFRASHPGVKIKSRRLNLKSGRPGRI